MSDTHVRPIQIDDNEALARIIRKVMPEFGAGGAGFAIHDQEVDDMFGAYTQPRSAYFVVVNDDHQVIGGAGIAPLEGGAHDTCELKKMYFLNEARGKGLGQKTIELCIEAAREQHYNKIYLETLASMTQARALYHKNGFKLLSGPLGKTGHFGCDTWYLKQL